jgi:alanine racemase
MEYTVHELAEILNVKEYDRNFSHLLLKHPEFDSRHVINPELSLFFALKGNQTDGHDFIPELKEKGVKVFVVSEKYQVEDSSACYLKTKDVLLSLQKLASHHRSRFLIPVIGITGSNGKTIVKEWLASILQAKFNICKSPKSFNSQLGVALSVLELNENHQLGIFEAGISRAGEMNSLKEMIQPTIGLLTNIGDAHQAGFTGKDEKTREKLKLFEGVSKFIYCKDYESVAYHRKFHLNNISWSRNDAADYGISGLYKKPEGLSINVKHSDQEFQFTLGFEDEASIENLIHCIVVSLELGMKTSAIQKGLSTLQNLAMRLEQKEGINGCILINDSYSLDFKSLQLALQFVDQQNHQLPRTIMLTDFAEQKSTNEFWSSVEYLLTKFKIQKLIGIGKNIVNIKSFLSPEINFYHYQTTEQLIDGIDSLFLKDELILIKGARKYQLEKVFHYLSLSKHDTILEIDLKAITHNLQVYRSYLNKDTKIMAVVKAAAYGSGHYEIARLLEHKKIDYLAVAYPDEGIILRQKGIQTPIMVMNTGTADFSILLDYQLEPEIFSIHQCKRLIKELGSNTQVSIHLKLDTGMHRLGFLNADINELTKFLKNNPQIKIKSIFSHLAGSDSETWDAFTREQANLFDLMTSQIIEFTPEKPLLHLLNSGGVTRHADLQYDMIRLGIGMYGIDSNPEIASQLEKAHTLKTRISQIKRYPSGETVSYNRSGILDSDVTIAVLSIGYADGLPRNSGINGYSIWCNKLRLPLKGLICMDMCMADVTSLEHVQEGTEVEIFGKNAPIEELAKRVQTIPYEILCGISPRVKRVFLQD